METIGTVLDRIEAQQVSAMQLKPDAMSLDLLQAIYRSNSIPLAVRMRAAGMAIAYEHPKLIATAMVTEQSFAELLDQRLKRMEANNSVKVIEHRPVEAPKPLPRLADRRYRRM